MSWLTQTVALQGSNAAKFIRGKNMSTLIDAAALDRLPSLKKSERMPVLFVGHGSPLNAIGDKGDRRRVIRT